MAINRRDTIAGAANTASYQQYAVLWNRAGMLTDLGTLAAGQSCWVVAINDQGMVAGYASTSTAYHAMRWPALIGYA